MLLRVCVVLLLIHVAEGLMCYECADSSDESGKNDCQKWARTQRYYRRRYEQKGIMGKYMKNCTGFGDLPEWEIYCMITAVELGGGVRSYIKGCSNGNEFFSADYNAEFKNKILPDNQTSCLYTGQGYLACVTLCGQEMGDFCNGPTAGTTNLTLSPLIYVLVAVLSFMYFRDS